VVAGGTDRPAWVRTLGAWERSAALRLLTDRLHRDLTARRARAFALREGARRLLARRPGLVAGA
jgi:hypothetical protein